MPATRANKYTDRELLCIAFWWYKGLRGQAPQWVKVHPMWPENNKKFWQPRDPKNGMDLTADPAGDRLWEAIALEFEIDFKEKPKS